MYYMSSYKAPMGTLTLVSNESCLIGAWFEGQKYYMESVAKEDVVQQETDVLVRTKKWLDDYFSGRMPALITLPLAPQGSAFRKLVWHILCQIPYGQVRTYKEIANEVASYEGKDHMSAQAVGGAIGHNPMSIIIPCHRVVGTKGSLTGYAGGLDKKKALLQHEGANLTQKNDNR